MSEPRFVEVTVTSTWSVFDGWSGYEWVEPFKRTLNVSDVVYFDNSPREIWKYGVTKERWFPFLPFSFLQANYRDVINDTTVGCVVVTLRGKFTIAKDIRSQYATA